MIIAKQKKQENPAEYVLYMWQIEDMIRACNFDMQTIREKLIEGYKVDEDTKTEIEAWYEGLIRQMQDEGIRDKGHLQSLVNQTNDLNDYHKRLLSDDEENSYLEFAEIAKPNIQLFREKSKDKNSNDVEVCLNALYSLLMLRLQKREVSKDTENAMNSFSNLLGLLSKKYLEFHKGETEL